MRIHKLDIQCVVVSLVGDLVAAAHTDTISPVSREPIVKY